MSATRSAARTNRVSLARDQAVWQSGRVDPIHPDFVRVALDKVTGSQFEKFVHEFYSGYLGEAFIPLGGMADGGADGFEEPGVWVQERTRRFLQASVEEDVNAKIAATIARLREFGRQPDLLTYVTSRVVKHVDVVEEQLSTKLDVVIRIRDGAFIGNNINHSPHTAAAYRNHLESSTAYLFKPGNTGLMVPTPEIRSPAIYVFLRQEVERRDNESSLLDAVIDSMAIWALEETDPDAGIFMTREEVLEKITAEVPTARDLIDRRLGKRLEAMSKKSYPGGRAVSWHRAEDLFCLPYSARTSIANDNLADEALRLAVADGIAERIREVSTGGDVPEADVSLATDLALRTLQLAYESEGLEFTKFLEMRDQGQEFPTVADHLRRAFDELAPKHRNRIALTEVLFSVLRDILYSSSETERRYLGRLSRTYALLFVMRTDPKLVHYFQRMAANFYLYVGADQLVRAISERYLPEADQAVRIMFRMAAEAGAQLVLTAPVLDEVVSHLRATDSEYMNHVAPMEAHLTMDFARNIPKILLRAYCYARLDPQRHQSPPSTWPAYVGHLCDYRDLRKPRAIEQIRNYLCAQFKMQYMSREDLTALVNEADLERLTSKLMPAKGGNLTLARNDAMLALSVYGRRSRERETSITSVFGYRTWWLTDEARILPLTAELIAHHNDARYMMRPDFLLNFIALSPTTAQVRETYQRVFPTLLGVRMSRRMDETVFHELIATIKGWDAWDEGRRVAALANLADTLKADFQKQYAVTIAGPGEPVARTSA